MLIGYDGFGVNFGTNKTVYCGAEGFIASYGDSLFNPNRSLEKASCHFLMTAIKKTALYMLDS